MNTNNEQNLKAEITALRSQLEQQQATINRLLALMEGTTGSSSTTLSSADATNTTKGITSTSRRNMLKRLATTVGTSLVFGTALVALPESKDAQARLVSNPTGVNNQIGVFVTPPGAANPTSTPVDNTIKFGLVASSSTTAFDMSGLPVGNDVAIYGYTASGTGVYGDNHDGFGVYGRSATFFGVVGMGNSDTGVGVAGVSDTGVGVQATSGGGGVPFQIVAGNTPLTLAGSLQPGMMYTDTDGNLYVWGKGTGNTFGWRKVTVV